ncbi:hypothetical protein LJB42_004435 [Komagataella kurtzmanii]|nr:hypothetical protein LJB42_004435 [Komagataella kurtzmanii]
MNTIKESKGLTASVNVRSSDSAATFPPVIAKLFEPKPPFKFLEPVDYPIEQRRTKIVKGVGGLLDLVKKYSEEVPYTVTEGNQQRQQRLKQEKRKLEAEKLQRDLAAWNPEKDLNMIGDASRTIFVARLDYNSTEVDLQNSLGVFGEIDRIRVVRDVNTDKSKGYGFVVFKQPDDARTAYRNSSSLKINNRPVLVDIERGRTVKNWKPRRLGGGLGGRHYTKRQIEKLTRQAPRYDRYPPPERYSTSSNRGAYRGGAGSGGFRSHGGGGREGQGNFRFSDLRDNRRGGWNGQRRY